MNNYRYEQLWSKRSFTYFDSVSDKRIDDHETIAQFLKTINGKLFAPSYDFRVPRVQIGKDMAVLTYQLFADTNLINMAYDCIEVFQKEENGKWHESIPPGRLSAPWITTSTKPKTLCNLN